MDISSQLHLRTCQLNAIVSVHDPRQHRQPSQDQLVPNFKDLSLSDHVDLGHFTTYLQQQNESNPYAVKAVKYIPERSLLHKTSLAHLLPRHPPLPNVISGYLSIPTTRYDTIVLEMRSQFFPLISFYHKCGITKSSPKP